MMVKENPNKFKQAMYKRMTQINTALYSHIKAGYVPALIIRAYSMSKPKDDGSIDESIYDESMMSHDAIEMWMNGANDGKKKDNDEWIDVAGSLKGSSAGVDLFPSFGRAD